MFSSYAETNQFSFLIQLDEITFYIFIFWLKQSHCEKNVVDVLSVKYFTNF